MSNDLRHILERMTAIEAGITPVGVKQGLNTQQKSVDQLPALFRPHKIQALGAPTDPQHPMHGKLVGASESNELGQAIVGKVATDAGLPPALARSVAQNWPNQGLSETMAEIEEDMLSRMRQDLNAYIDQLGDRVSDDGRRTGGRPELGRLGQRDTVDRDLIDKVSEDPTQQELTVEPPTAPTVNPTLPESQLIRTLALEDGTVMEIHGSDQQGYEVRRGPRRMRTRFSDLAQAQLALDLFRARRREQSDSQDYVEEK
jgi:hypothetical protein